MCVFVVDRIRRRYRDGTFVLSTAMSDSDDDLFADDDAETAQSTASLFGVLHLLDEDDAKQADQQCTAESLAALLASRPENIVLSKQKIGDEGVQLLVEALAAAPAPAFATHLGLSTSDISDVGAQHLSSALAGATLSKLDHLDLSSNSISGGGLGSLASCLPRALSALDLSGNPLGDAGLARFGSGAVASGCLAQLGRLYLDRTQVGDEDCRALAAAAAGRGPSDATPLPQLAELWLSNNRIGDGGAAALFGALGGGAMPALGDLRLQFNQLGDAAIAALVAALTAGALARTWYLGLSDNDFGDAALTTLGDSLVGGGLPRLEFVTVAGRGTSADGEKELQDRLTRRPRAPR